MGKTTERPPATIRILGLTYAIDVVDTAKSGDDTLGTMVPGRARITLCSTNSPEMLASVLVHEIVEALNWRLELKLKHRQISALDAGLTQVLRDNPGLVKFLG